jgi:hypothetical protein
VGEYIDESQHKFTESAEISLSILHIVLSW